MQQALNFTDDVRRDDIQPRQRSYRQTVNVFQDSPSAMAAILKLHFPHGTIVDVNFGLGVFYKKVRRDVVGVDIRPPAQIICDNRRLPFAADSFEVGVCDPPYKRGNGDKKYPARYGIAPCTEPRVTRSYFELLPELVRVSRSGVIIKCQDASDGHRVYLRHVTLIQWMKEQTGLDPHDIGVIAREYLPAT